MTSDFSRRFAAALRGVMAEHDVQQQHVAARLGRSKGYISEHVSGKRAVDSDILEAVAGEVGKAPEELIEQIASRMRNA